jgi:hypothetical protein
MNTKKYPPVGACVYCRSEGDPQSFTDEHIVPLGIGGKWVLPCASCKACQDCTQRFENDCIRHLFSAARPHAGIKGRSRSKHTYAPVYVASGTSTRRIKVQIERHPGYLISFGFVGPEILKGIAPKEKMGARFIETATVPNFAERVRPYLKEGFVMDGISFPPYLRMLAKIAHTYACAELGMYSFEPVLTRLILGSEPLYPAHYVGTAPEPFPSRSWAMHELNLDTHEDDPLGEYVVVRIRLFSRYDTPVHKIVVGRKILERRTLL